jgi:predicted metalloprotease with PDZ domain
MKWRVTIFLGTLLALALPASATIRYRISVAHPERHFFRVIMDIPQAQPGIVVNMPAWNALYQIRDFSYRVQGVQAVRMDSAASALPLMVIKLTKDSWRIDWPAPGANNNGPIGPVGPATLTDVVELRYRVYWDDPGPFNSQLNPHHAFVNFAEVLFYIPARRQEDTRVEFTDVPANWKAAAELPSGGAHDSFVAPNYDALVDAPAELGAFAETGFSYNGARYRVTMDGEADQAALVDGLRRIVKYETGLMGGAPFREYLFIFHIGHYAEAGGGGMEHANCTAISAATANGALDVAAHEFFHVWNVKRIRPQSLEPVDYSREQYTRALWFAEGVTSTYGRYALLRSGLSTRGQFYADLAAQIEELQSRPARLWKSVEESSLDAWLEKYDFYSRPDISISYYDKGQILGDFLDLTIRDATGNRQSLDDVMRRMNTEYALRGKFYDDSAGIRRVAEEVAGRDLGGFFSQYVAGTAELPYDRLLAVSGLELHMVPSNSLDLGFEAARGLDGRTTVSEVTPGGPAQAAGLVPGDLLVLLDGQPFPRSLPRWMAEHLGAGQAVQLTVEHSGVQKQFAVIPRLRGDSHYQIVESPNATERQLRIREGWLQGVTSQSKP